MHNLNIVHNWTRVLPENCIIQYVKFESDWIIIGLYCSDSIEEISIDIVSGRIQRRKSSELELIGYAEFRKNFYVITCYKGLNKRLWNRIEKSLNSKVICRQNTCVTASLKPNRVLEVKVIDARNEEIESINIENTYDFQIGSSLSLVVLTTTGIRQEYSSTLLIDPSTISIIDHISGFGGYVVESTDYVLVYGFSRGGYVTKIYDYHGEEVFEINGVPVLIPFNPLAYRVHRDKLFEFKLIAIIDRNDVKAINPYDFSIVFTSIKPPFTRGVLNIDVETYSLIVYSVLWNKPLIIKYDSNGTPLVISPQISSLRYGLFTNKIAAIYVERERGETRLYSIRDNIMVHEESFGPGVFPLVIKGDTIILTDSRKISSYSMERAW
ncbi:MAG: hypothetical protein QW615_04530 [Desulfurococcaceae archaeon]